MGETRTYRSGFSRGLAVTTVALTLVLLGRQVLDAGPAALVYAAPVALVGLLAWLAFWRPCIEVSDGGVRLRNVWRTVHVPWPALREVDDRLGLRLVTAYGSYQAWAAPAPRRARGGPAVPGEAALLVRQRWDELRAAGWLEDPRLERPRADVRLHTVSLAAAIALTVLSALVLLG